MSKVTLSQGLSPGNLPQNLCSLSLYTDHLPSAACEPARGKMSSPREATASLLCLAVSQGHGDILGCVRAGTSRRRAELPGTAASKSWPAAPWYSKRGPQTGRWSGEGTRTPVCLTLCPQHWAQAVFLMPE